MGNLQTTLVKRGKQARKALLRGVNEVFNTVKLTLGPGGRNVMIFGTYGRDPRITNDGVRVARSIVLDDECENDAAQRFVEASKKTNERVGDGTTSTVVLAGTLINQVFNDIDEKSSALDIVKTNHKPVELRKKILESVDKVLKLIAKQSTKIDSLSDLEKIAIVSVEDEKLGKVVAKMVWEIGVNGHIDILEGHSQEIEIENSKGMKFKGKWADDFFINIPEHKKIVANDIPVIITDYAIEDAKVLNDLIKSIELTRFAIFAPSYSRKIINLVMKSVLQSKGNFELYLLTTPSLLTEELEDFALYTGAKFINKKKDNLEYIQKSDMGLAHRLIVTTEEISIRGGNGDKQKVNKQIEILKKQLSTVKNEMHKKKLERRIASIDSAIGVIKVGAATQAEIIYLKDKLEDAQYAAKAALAEGYVKGGGVCLKDIATKLGKKDILYKTLMSPYEQIQDNAGGDLKIDENVIDPTKVVRLSVKHAISLASSFVSIDAIVSQVKDRNSYEGFEKVASMLNMQNKIEARQRGLGSEWGEINKIGE